MFRRHFFLIAFLGVLALMLVVGGVRLMAGKGDNQGQNFQQAAGKQGGPKQGAGKQGAGKQGGGPNRPGGGGGGFGGGSLVTPVTATLHAFDDRIEVLGVAKGRESVTITSNTLELVTRVRFRDRQRVNRGEILIDLQADEEDAGVATAKVAMDQAKRQYDRFQALAARGVAPLATAEQYEASYRQAEANLAAAQSRRANRTIRAPFSGVVGLTDVAPGSLINPGTAIVTLDDISMVRVDFDVPDRYLPVIRQGTPIVARPDVLPGVVANGRIARVDSRINERTRAVRARAEFPNPDGKLMPGMLMRISIAQGQRQAIGVPEPAVLFEGDQASVWVLVEQEGQIVAQRRPIVAGASAGGYIEVKEGLTLGERVVRDGVNNVQSGPVQLMMPRNGANTPANAQAGSGL